jgi:hypothetical protein
MPNGDIIVEHGDNHREVYVSESNSALSAQDIAAMAGVSANQVTGKWLMDNPQYGADPSTCAQDRYRHGSLG